MTTEIKINDNNRTIEVTKKFSTAASRYGTREYEDLQDVRRAYPKYNDYYGAAEPPVRCGVSHLSGPTEPPDYYKLL